MTPCAAVPQLCVCVKGALVMCLGCYRWQRCYGQIITWIKLSAKCNAMQYNVMVCLCTRSVNSTLRELNWTPRLCMTWAEWFITATSLCMSVDTASSMFSPPKPLNLTRYYKPPPTYISLQIYLSGVLLHNASVRSALLLTHLILRGRPNTGPPSLSRTTSKLVLSQAVVWQTQSNGTCFIKKKKK